MTTLSKQALINLLIDAPLREAIKINLVDIVNNTNDADLEKTYSTISKELEIYQKATERRLKLAGETIAQLSGSPAPVEAAEPTLPPLPPLPPMPEALVEVPNEVSTTSAAPLTVPPLDLPPMPSEVPAATTATTAAESDEAALQEIQKELDALKNSATVDAQ
ncbi:MAG: hypothetical protein WCL07_03650 [bacterium]